MFELVITADTNDADYVTETHKVTQEDINKLAPIVQAIKTRNASTRRGSGQYNWAVGELAGRREGPGVVYKDILTEDQIEWFTELCPMGEYGIHTIESIEYYPMPLKVKLL